MMTKTCLVPAVVIALAGAAAGGAWAMPARPLSATAETAHYRLVLQIGSEETMYSKADAAKMHPTSGEVMVSDTMAGMGAMPQGMAMDMRHLEVHVADRATGGVVTDAACRITVTDDATGKSQVVPIVTMYGVREGVSDWHYGNNGPMPPGSYTVTVTVNGEQAVFHVTLPKT
jgi:hypothetical protein